MFKKLRLLIIPSLLILAVGCAPKKVEETSLLLGLAASLTDVSVDLEEVYEASHTEVDLNFTYGASGDLQLQIEQGAPMDFFISASPKQMTALADKDLILADSITPVLSNSLVLIAPHDTKLKLSSFEDAALPEVESIAIGEVKTVPVGQYTEEVFESLNLSDAIAPKAHYANNVRQVLSWVETSAVDCGIVYKTDAISSDKITILSEAPENTHTPIQYDAGIVSDSKNLEAAKDFMAFLKTEEAQAIFEKHGFKRP